MEMWVYSCLTIQQNPPLGSVGEIPWKITACELVPRKTIMISCWIILLLLRNHYKQKKIRK